MATAQRESIYDRLRPHLDAEDLLRRLGVEIVRASGAEAYCRPLCHDSTSGESLQVNLHTGKWNCKACQLSGVHGDLFQLVEYVQSGGGAPSKGANQGASDGHRRALAWLCEQYGVPYDEGRIARDPALDVVHMFAMAAHQYLLENQKVLAWVEERWGFDIETVRGYGIGYMPAPILPSIAKESSEAGSRDAFKRSGIGWHDSDGRWHTHFEGRVIFPYLENGRAVYLIGRATDWTPQPKHGRRPAKYHKLSVHSDRRPYVSPMVTNDHLYNESVMQGSDTVVVAEGVADAVALSSIGVPVVSPVTISFNATDLERFVRKARERKLRRVEILFDNELSGSGNYAARRVGKKLVEHGLVVKILTIPLGDAQQKARDEVRRALGDEKFVELERSDPQRRKEMISEAFPGDDGKRAWVHEHIGLSKIDAAEWTASEGPGAATRFHEIRSSGEDVIELEIRDVCVDADDDPETRVDAFKAAIELSACVESRMQREAYAGLIAKCAGKGVSKAEIARRIAQHRREVVAPRKKEERKRDRPDTSELEREMLVLPPETEHATPKAPPPPAVPKPATGAPPAPPPPGQKEISPHERYAPVREMVAKAIDAGVSEERMGEYVAQTILKSMRYTPFRTPEDLYLVRGSERIRVGLTSYTPRFSSLIWLASGLTNRKSSHRPYIFAVAYFLEMQSRKARDVAWSHVDDSGAVYFPTGDQIGRIIKIEPGRVTRTKMASVQVPAVAGEEFLPFTYTEDSDGIERVLEIFRWTSLSPADRMALVYWITCLPILRRVGTIPIMRIEGGSGSGKTRIVDAVSWTVNGQKSSSVPTPAALVSRMSIEMLTIDDNRESRDLTDGLLATLLQATHLGAREKRKVNTDTGTIVERVAGALLMNGIEPVHDGRSELASRIIVLRASPVLRTNDSPSAEEALRDALLQNRNDFWSTAVRRCAGALELDAAHGEAIGSQIEALFAITKIGRLSAYLRLMYLAWVVGLPPEEQCAALESIADPWLEAFQGIASTALASLVAEELSVTVLRYAFAYGASVATAPYTGADQRTAFGGKYVEEVERNVAYLGPMRATQLARIARAAGKELNGPRAVSYDLRAGQLEARLLDGLGFIRESGFAVELDHTSRGAVRFTFCRLPEGPAGDGEGAGAPAGGDPQDGEGDLWDGHKGPVSGGDTWQPA